MIDYLEELDMAYREDLSTDDLIACGQLFRRAAGADRTWKQMASRGVFEAAHAVTGLMDDLHSDFLTRNPKFARPPYINTETWYAKYWEHGWDSAYHHLGWQIRKKDWKIWRLSCSIYWDDSGRASKQACFWIEYEGTSVVKPSDDHWLITNFFKGGKLDRGKLLNRLESHLAELAVLTKRR